MSNHLDNNSDSNSDSENENESNNESEKSTLTGDSDSINSDDDEVFIRFNSTTNYDLVDYIMIGSTCYAYPDSDTESEENTDSQHNSECLHDVLIYFINGYIDQQMMTKKDIIDLFQLQGIDLRGHDVFNHLLE